MKFKLITITFPRPLNQAQEYQLCADIHAVVKEIGKEIAKYREKMDTHIEFKVLARTPGGGAMLDLMKAKLLQLELNIYRYFLFEKSDTNARVYTFAHAHQELSAINFKVPGFKFKVAKGEVFREAQFINALKTITFKSIGFTPHEVKVELSEYEKVEA